MGAVNPRLGTRPLAGWFRSVELWLAADAASEDFSAPVSALSAWLADVDDWYRAALEDHPGPRGNGHLLYNRMVTLRTPRCPLLSQRLIELGRTCREHGFGFSAAIDLGGSPEEEGAVEDLAKAGLTTQLFIHLPDQGLSMPAGAWLALVERLARAGIGLAFCGDVAVFRTLGTTRSAVLSARAHRYLPARGQGGAQQDLPECGPRLGLFVAADGWVYPCRQLMGVPWAQLCLVGESSGPDSFGKTLSALDLRALEAVRPQAPDNSSGRPAQSGDRIQPPG